MPASELAQQHAGRPVPNAALLGGFAAMTGVVSIESVAAAIRDRFGGEVGEGNVAAAQAAYDSALRQLGASPADAAGRAPGWLAPGRRPPCARRAGPDRAD